MWWNNDPAIHQAAKYANGPDNDMDIDYLPNRIEDTNLNEIFDQDKDNPPTGNFPGPEDVDTDGNGILHLESWHWHQLLSPGAPDPEPSDDEDWMVCLDGKSVTGNHSKDWADPGMQHKTTDTYDD